MFGSKDSLPVHGGLKNNGISGIPVVNKSVALSLVWVVASICVFILGIWHCRSNAYSFNLDCQMDVCKFSAYKQQTQQIIEFPKSDLVDAELARIDDKGDFLDAEAMRRQKSNRAGYSVRFKVRLPIESGSKIKTEQAIIFSPVDMGRREARNGATKITKYLHVSTSTEDSKEEKGTNKRNAFTNIDPKNKVVHLQAGKSITALGAISAFLSIVSLAAAFIFGTWSETTRRGKLKKAA
jgi:hypothetical protein